MEKYEKYNPDEETIEAWLKGFEIRLLCNNITAADGKHNFFFLFFMNGNTERAQCALSRVCIP